MPELSRNEIEKRILHLLKASKVLSSEREDIDIMMPILSIEELKRILAVLENESLELKRLDKQRQRLELQYRVMVEKLMSTQKR